MHFIWRLSWIVSLENLKVTIILVRIMSAFLIGYSFTRAYFIFLNLKVIKFKKEIVLLFIILLLIYFPRWSYLLLSFQVAYSFIPLLLAIIIKDIQIFNNELKNKNRYLSNLNFSKKFLFF